MGGTVAVNGTNGDDTLYIPAGYDITQVSVNGGKGFNTLDLSTYQPNVTPGVRISIEPAGARSPGSVVSNSPFHGVVGSTVNTSPSVFGTISNIQHIIGTTGNDNLGSSASLPYVYLDGGAGNDFLMVSGATTAKLVGGTGYDWLETSVGGATLVGGSLNSSGTPNHDSSYDTFEIGIYGAAILDFDPATDRLIFTGQHSYDAGFATATWVSDGQNGSKLMVNGTARVDLIGVPLSTAANISFGHEYIVENGSLYGGPGNDVLRSSNNATVQVGPNLGNDIITNFNTTDTLHFTSDVQVSWSDTVVNGQHSLLGTFAGGSVTLTGLGTSDLGSLHIDGLTTPSTIDPVHHMSWWSVPSDINLI